MNNNNNNNKTNIDTGAVSLSRAENKERYIKAMNNNNSNNKTNIDTGAVSKAVPRGKGLRGLVERVMSSIPERVDTNLN